MTLNARFILKCVVDGSTFVVGFEFDQTHIDVARRGVEGVGWRA